MHIFSDRKNVKNYLVAIIMLFSGNVFAGTLVEVGATYLSDAFATPTSQSSSSYFYNVGVLFNLNKKTWGGWNYSGISSSLTSTTTTTFTSLDTGPYLKWQYGKGEMFSLSFAYNLLSQATFSDGTTDETWTGTSMWLQWGIAPEVSEGVHVGASLNYFSASYSKKVVSTVESSASNSKTWIFPMLMFTKKW